MIGNEKKIKIIIPRKLNFLDLKIVPKIIIKITKNSGLIIMGKILLRYIIFL